MCFRLGDLPTSPQPTNAVPINLFIVNMAGYSHRAGSLKQSNKKHKGTAASKREAKRALGPGRVAESAGESRHGTNAGSSNMAM